ncbi:MAG: DUF4177 domain-containing protein [Rhodobacteraceae bacterium]|nr:DUF4177 domain-containing protein [Paracoccaceae bacterium]
MQRYEYKVVPAPHKGVKAKGVRSPEGRFANSIELQLNELAAEGWEFLRAELLPSEERSGLTGSTTNWRNLLVFRRELAVTASAAADEVAADVQEPAPTSSPDPEPKPAPEAPKAEKDVPAGLRPLPGPGSTQLMEKEEGDDPDGMSGLSNALKLRAKQKNGDYEDETDVVVPLTPAKAPDPDAER